MAAIAPPLPPLATPPTLLSGTVIYYNWRPPDGWTLETIVRPLARREDLSTRTERYPLAEQWLSKDTEGEDSRLWLPSSRFNLDDVGSWRVSPLDPVFSKTANSAILPAIFNAIGPSPPIASQKGNFDNTYVNFAASAADTLSSLLQVDHISDDVPFQSAFLALPSQLSMDTFLSRKFVLSATFSATSLLCASSVLLQPPSGPLPLPFQGDITVNWNRMDRRFNKFADEHGFQVTQSAYMKEMNGLIEAGCLSEPVDLPSGHVAPRGEVLCSQKACGLIKCRCVYRGDFQVENVNYDPDGLYAPVMDRTSFRMLIAIGAAHHAFIHTLDVNLAFLYGDMPEEIYMAPPLGVNIGYNKVFRLLKSLYGTKQAPAIWYGVISGWFLQNGFTAAPSDKCVFIKRTGTDFLFVGLHVDDMCVVCTSQTMLDEFKTSISARFSLKDQGTIDGREFTGCMVKYDQAAGIAQLSCDRSVRKLLEAVKYEGSYAHTTPTTKQNRDSTPSDSPLCSLFGTIVGHANWISVLCRPDIALASSMLSSANWNLPTFADIKDVKRLLRYLSGTLTKFPGIGPIYSANIFQSIKQALTPVSFVDADHAGAIPETFKSRSGQLIFLCGGPIWWKSSLQKTVAISSTYSEIIALSDLCKRLVWVLALLNDLGFPQSAVPVHEDNQPSIDILQSQKQNERTRHYHIRYMWTRQLIENGVIELLKIDTFSNLADFFTKVLSIDDQKRFIFDIVLRPLCARFFPAL